MIVLPADPELCPLSCSGLAEICDGAGQCVNGWASGATFRSGGKARVGE